MVNYEEVTSYSEGKVDDLCSTLAKKPTAVNKSTSTKKKKKHPPFPTNVYGLERTTHTVTRNKQN